MTAVAASGAAARLRPVRAASQAAFLALFVGLLVGTGISGVQEAALNRFFFAIDPLLALTEALTTKTVALASAIALIPVVLTLLLGRFFCGWVCPMGAINHFVSWAATLFGRPPRPVDRRRAGVRYLVLAAVVVLAAGGTRVGVLVDPIALLGRSLAAFVLPAAGVSVGLRAQPQRVEQPGQPLSAEGRPGLEAGAGATAWLRSRVVDRPGSRRVTQHAAGVALIFMVIVGLNLYRRRFFCGCLCPLGALYGLAARVSIVRVRAGDDCTRCGSCAGSCPSHAGPAGPHSSQDCVMCLNCVAECPQGAATVALVTPEASPGAPLNVGRRQLFATAMAGLGVSAMVRLGPEGRTPARRFVRPPGALPEPEFLDRCLRCGQCVQACPTGFIQPAALESGTEGLWTPIVNAETGYCAWDCAKCTGACPSGALRPLSLAEKQVFKIGTAVVDRSRCYTWADGIGCTICVDRCPVPGNALVLRDGDTWSFAGDRVAVKRIHVAPDRCTGCGICEHVCPRLDAPGIAVGCDDEQRHDAFEALVSGG